ncbi:uncharacterized protein PHA67_003134 isoform 2-T2 [Liasis olivaceus]
MGGCPFCLYQEPQYCTSSCNGSLGTKRQPCSTYGEKQKQRNGPEPRHSGGREGRSALGFFRQAPPEKRSHQDMFIFWTNGGEKIDMRVMTAFPKCCDLSICRQCCKAGT